MTELKAGAATVDITPKESHFLFGYPFVDRMSKGTHDTLLSSALYISDCNTQILFISNNVIYVTKGSVARIRRKISLKTGIPLSHILIAATHTHSAPVTAELVISGNDPVVPSVDSNYLNFMEDSTVEAACRAYSKAEPARIGFTTGDASGVGTNRHNPEGPKDMELPVLLVRNLNNEFIACMLICNMHPTILHEDSTLYSGDFPYFTGKSIQERLGKTCTVIYFTGTAGNQSPRHVTKSNTFKEAERIGNIVSEAILSQSVDTLNYFTDIQISVIQKFIDLPKRKFPPVEWAEQHRDKSKKLFKDLQKSSTDPREIRTAEVNWFGTEELLYLSTLAQSDKLNKAYKTILPVEIQVIKVGNLAFIAWPGEIFVEFGLALKKQFNNIFMITYANGELQGYIVTKEAHEKGFYEAGNSFFEYISGEIMLEQTIKMLKELGQ